MTVQELIDRKWFLPLNIGSDTERDIKKVFCCDLLSIAMSRGSEDAAWITVMGNTNTLAVLALTDMCCIILAEGANMDEAGLAKAKEQEITILKTELPIFEAALKIHEGLKT